MLHCAILLCVSCGSHFLVC
uniref:Uncharacterized protein n=1 Tax=Rhizophora mucronata TaxID=61149 RepID=A0A2P2PTU1_RHIMU